MGPWLPRGREVLQVEQGNQTFHKNSRRSRTPAFAQARISEGGVDGGPANNRLEFQDLVRAARIEHSGTLELNAALLAIKWAAHATHRHGKRVLTLLDAKAVLGGLQKGRSSSRILGRILQKTGAHLVAADLDMRYLYVPTEDMPADAPSRGVRSRPQRRRALRRRGFSKADRSLYRGYCALRMLHCLVHCTLCIVHCALCIAHCGLRTVGCVLCQRSARKKHVGILVSGNGIWALDMGNQKRAVRSGRRQLATGSGRRHLATACGNDRGNQQRVAKEQRARTQRGASPVRNNRKDAQQPTFSSPRAYPQSGGGSGGGAFGPWILLLLLPLLAVRRNRSS